MEITASTLVADIAAHHPRSIEVFERHGIDFCCGGRRLLGEACREHGAAVEDVAAEIAVAAAREVPEDRVFTDAPLGELLDHIVSRYHTALREDLPRLGRLADKVAEVHGSRHPELAELARVYQGLHDELTPHLATEEERVFPAVRRVAEPGAVAEDLQAALHALEEAHDRAGTALARLRALSGGFAVPEDGCTTYRALYEGLVRFERELHEHVHLENNVLFPRVVSLQAHAADRGNPVGAGALSVAGRWEDAGVVRGFSTAAANDVLLAFVRAELARRPGLRILDLGCGAARNAAPMAAEGATVVGTDVAWPMLEAARRRVEAAGVARRVALVRAPMDHLPLRDASVDLVVAHGVWNLARSAGELRRAVAEAARVARPGAGLFVFTFSRATLAADDPPVPGEAFVFTQFAGEPQCFLTEAELVEELRRAGFEKDPQGPLTEYNRPVAGRSLTRGGPVIYEGTFRAVRQH